MAFAGHGFSARLQPLKYTALASKPDGGEHFVHLDDSTVWLRVSRLNIEGNTMAAKKPAASAKAAPAKESNSWVGKVEEYSRKIWLAGLGVYSKIDTDGSKLFDSHIKSIDWRRIVVTNIFNTYSAFITGFRRFFDLHLQSVRAGN